jgi:glucan-binding YG repeat protein
MMCCISHAKAENTGWVKKDGYWYYYSSQNTYYTNGAYYIDGNRYYFDSMGIMQANKWVSDYGTWMYAGPGGELVTGWKKINNKWYWFDSWGELCPQDGGTYKIDGKTYLFDQNGALIQFRSGWYEQTITYSSGEKEIYGYTLNAEGVVCAGWASYAYVYSSGEKSATYWYCLNASGDRMNGWQKINGKWYYFDLWDSTLCFQSDAAVGCSIHAVEGNLYYFNMGGGLIQGESGWRKIRQLDDYGSYRDRWCYLLKSGTVMTGWHEVEGRTYYFEEDTGLLYPSEDECQTWVDYCPKSVNGRIYIFRKDGSLLTGKAGWIECTEQWQRWDYYETYWSGYTIDENGAVQPGWTRTRAGGWSHDYELYQYLDSSLEPVTGWKLIKGKKYYFDENGNMVCNCAKRINGANYLFDCDGVLVEGKIGFYKLTVKRWSAFKGMQTSYEWYYFGDKEELATGWQKDNGKWYWFNDDPYSSDDENSYGRMAGLNGGLCKAGDGVYCFEKGGALVQGKKGWQKLADGSWFYLNSDGSVCTGFTEIDGKTYYFNSSGILHTSGTATIDGDLYVFGPGGELINTPGWNKAGTDSNGNSKWYYIKNDGTAKTGWLYEDGKQYYFDDYDGQMYVNTVKLFQYSGSSSMIYLFDASGALVLDKKGWYKLNSGYQGSTQWFYFEDYGKVRTGYRLIGGKGYYFSEYDGVMYSDTVESINGELMLFGKDGARITKAGWYNSFQDFYVNENGEVQTGWKKISGKWYYFYPTYLPFYYIGSLAYGDGGVGFVYEEDKDEPEYYFFQKGGTLAEKGWNKLGDDWYYVDAAGHPLKGWQKIDGVWYYFGLDYKMYRDGVFMVEHRPEYFNQSGACETAVSGSNWKRVGGTLRYMVNGKYVTGWQKIGTKEYYFESNGDLKLD